MITLRELDAIRAKCTKALEEWRAAERCIIPMNTTNLRGQYLAAKRNAEFALEQWWTQGCREVPPPGVYVPPTPPRPERCFCGAYPWPANMAPGGVIGDPSGNHRADRCWAQPWATQGITDYLAQVLFSLTSDEPDSKYDGTIVAYRKRVKEAMIRNLFLIDMNDRKALYAAWNRWCCCGKHLLCSEDRIEYGQERHTRMGCRH